MVRVFIHKKKQTLQIRAFFVIFFLPLPFCLNRVSQLCPALQLQGLYSPQNSPGQNTRVGSLSLLQGIFPTQGLNPGLPLCRQILYQLSHKGSLKQSRLLNTDQHITEFTEMPLDFITLSASLPPHKGPTAPIYLAFYTIIAS